MEKIKIIDLLNKISRGDEIPNEIIFNGKKYKLDSFTNWYRHITVLGDYDDLFIAINRLNDYVEIVEKEKKIDIQEIKEFNDKEITTEEVEVTNENIKKLEQMDIIIDAMADEIYNLSQTQNEKIWVDKDHIKNYFTKTYCENKKFNRYRRRYVM